MNTVEDDHSFGVGRLMRRTVQHVSEHGLGYAMNRALWKMYYARFERLRVARGTEQATPPRCISLLGKEFQLHPSLRGLSEELALFGTHEPLGAQSYLQQLSPGDHVLDIGSNIGYWLLASKQAIGDSGRILGFEPVPEAYSILQRNIVMSGEKNVRVFPCAVGASNATAQFYQSEVSNWGSLIQQDGLRQTRPIDVQVRKLQDILGEFPDFHPDALRMDLEGAEVMILESARAMLARHKPCLFVEFHSAVLGWPTIRKTLVWLLDVGYTSGTLIERTWDQPWISRWIRQRRRWSGPIDFLMQRIECPRDPLTESTFTVILSGRARQNRQRASS